MLLCYASEGDLHVLEIGFGTGLNALDVWLRAKKAQRRVVMVSLEPNPLQWDDVACLGMSLRGFLLRFARHA